MLQYFLNLTLLIYCLTKMESLTVIISIIEGCKHNILYIFVTLFSIWNKKKIVLRTFLKKLASQNNLCHIIWTWKSTPKISPTIISLFKGLGMNLIMRINYINQKNYIKMFSTSILRCVFYLQKHFTYFQVLEL